MTPEQELLKKELKKSALSILDKIKENIITEKGSNADDQLVKPLLSINDNDDDNKSNSNNDKI
jgi:hypothetical protein